MGSIQLIKGKYFYVVTKTKIRRRWKNVCRKATDDEIRVYKSRVGSKHPDLAIITCGYPKCDQQISISREQKRDLNTTYPLRYNQFSLIYCSKACREAHTKDLQL